MMTRNFGAVLVVGNVKEWLSKFVTTFGQTVVDCSPSSKVWHPRNMPLVSIFSTIGVDFIYVPDIDSYEDTFIRYQIRSLSEFVASSHYIVGKVIYATWNACEYYMDLMNEFRWYGLDVIALVKTPEDSIKKNSLVDISRQYSSISIVPVSFNEEITVDFLRYILSKGFDSSGYLDSVLELFALPKHSSSAAMNQLNQPVTEL